VPHLLRDLAMQAADGVAIGGGVESQDGHGKRLTAIVGVAAAEGHETIEIDLRVAAVLAEVVMIDQPGSKRSMRPERAYAW